MTALKGRISAEPRLQNFINLRSFPSTMPSALQVSKFEPASQRIYSFDGQPPTLVNSYPLSGDRVLRFKDLAALLRAQETLIDVGNLLLTTVKSDELVHAGIKWLDMGFVVYRATSDDVTSRHLSRSRPSGADYQFGTPLIAISHDGTGVVSSISPWGQVAPLSAQIYGNWLIVDSNGFIPVRTAILTVKAIQELVGSPSSPHLSFVEQLRQGVVNAKHAIELPYDSGISDARVGDNKLLPRSILGASHGSFVALEERLRLA